MMCLHPIEGEAIIYVYILILALSLAVTAMGIGYRNYFFFYLSASIIRLHFSLSISNNLHSTSYFLKKFRLEQPPSPTSCKSVTILLSLYFLDPLFCF